MKTVGYVRVSTDKQAARGISLEAQAVKTRGMAKLLAMVEGGKVRAVTVSKLDRLTGSVKDLGELLDLSRSAVWR